MNEHTSDKFLFVAKLINEGMNIFHIELFKKKKVEKIQLLNLAVKSCAIIKCHFFRNWKRKSPFACFLGKIMSCFIRQCDGPLSHFAQLCSKLKITKLAPRSNRLNLLLISLSHLFARSQANLLPKRCNGTFLGVVNAIPSIFTASTLCGYLVRVRLIHGLSPHAHFQKSSLCMFQAYGASVDPLSVMVSLSET